MRLPSFALPRARRPPGAGEGEALAQACRALWLATLSLMSAALVCEDPAQRRALAQRIARNFGMLAREGDCFSPNCRATFSRLAARWERQGAPAPHERRPLH